MKRFIASFLAVFLFSLGVRAETLLFPVESYSITFANASTVGTETIGAYVTAIRLVSSSDAWIAIASTPSASVATGFFLPAKEPHIMGAKPGLHIAVIGESSGVGTLYVTEFSR